MEEAWTGLCTTSSTDLAEKPPILLKSRGAGRRQRQGNFVQKCFWGIRQGYTPAGNSTEIEQDRAIFLVGYTSGVYARRKQHGDLAQRRSNSSLAGSPEGIRRPVVFAGNTWGKRWRRIPWSGVFAGGHICVDPLVILIWRLFLRIKVRL